MGPRPTSALLLFLVGCMPVSEEPIPVACAEVVPAAAARAPGGNEEAGTGQDGALEGAAADAAAPADTAASGATAPVGPTDTLDLLVILDSVPPGPGSVRLRVDGLAEPGIVRFFQPPATAAAAAMALTPLPSFQGCAPVAATGLQLRAPRAPHGKAWVRVSTDRTVRLRVTILGGRPTTQPALVDPGASGVARWSAAP